MAESVEESNGLEKPRQTIGGFLIQGTASGFQTARHWTHQDLSVVLDYILVEVI